MTLDHPRIRRAYLYALVAKGMPPSAAYRKTGMSPRDGSACLAAHGGSRPDNWRRLADLAGASEFMLAIPDLVNHHNRRVSGMAQQMYDLATRIAAELERTEEQAA